MSWIVVSRRYFETNGDDEVLMLMALVEILIFSLDRYRVFVEG